MMEDIGTIRRALFTPRDTQWNSLVRLVTARYEVNGRVDEIEVLRALVGHMKDTANRMQLEEELKCAF